MDGLGVLRVRQWDWEDGGDSWGEPNGEVVVRCQHVVLKIRNKKAAPRIGRRS